ncbi:MAG: hypothetical protein FWH04_08995 [Oscillospiraceae bacterium]|nr:hypothetical protein [Oscillospiraceae bacterium]
MVKVIMGVRGLGKTKQMIDLINARSRESEGATVCLVHGRKLNFDISHNARLIDTTDYNIKSYQVLRGFITGIYAGNYDLKDVFIDSLFKISNNNDMNDCERFLSWCETFGGENNIDFTISISADPDTAPQAVKKYIGS